jgi:tetratricopeptide (TPR) repeat protein
MTTSSPSAAATLKQRLADIETALAASDMARATALAEQSLEEGARHPLFYNLSAWRLEQEGRLEDSVGQLQAGLNAFSSDVQLLTTLGFTLIQLEKRAEAVEVFGRTVRLYPDYPPARYGLGSAYGRLGELKLAQAEYERAVQLAPNYTEAWSGLADIAERRHAFDESRAHVQRALAIDPHHLDALLTLARLESVKRDYTGAETRIRRVLTDPRLTPMARGNALVLLGDVLENQGRLDEAWDAYVDGKAEHHRAYAPMFEGPGKTSPADSARRLAVEFAETESKDWSGPPDAAARGEAASHAFLFGFARSGTTLLEQILATHPDVCALEERPTLYDAEMEFAMLAGGTQRLAAMDAAALEPFREAYWRRVRGFGAEPKGKTFIDKFPLNTPKMPMMVKLFPEAKLLFALRDPRDVVVSCFRRAFQLNSSMYQFVTLEGAARYYDAVMSGARLYRERLTAPLHEVRYEALVDDFEGEVGKICDFLGLEWTDELKNFADTAKKRGVSTPSASQVGRGLYREGMGQWRRYAAQLEPVKAILAPWVDYYGYPAD